METYHLPPLSHTFDTIAAQTPTPPGGTVVPTPPVGARWCASGCRLSLTHEGNSPASSLLKARLDQFASENPDVRLEVRAKALEGAGGLLDSLVAANVAAPLALPDLVLLPRPVLESAAC